MKIKVSVPATSANIGSGFDALGLAVTLYNTVTFEDSEVLDISSADGTRIPRGESNLVYRSAKGLFEKVGKQIPPLKITQTNPIPMARGLGSSSACIIAGLLGANRMLGDVLNTQELLTLATSIEGHPDNVAPALLGGLTSSVFEEGKVYSVKRNVDETLCFAAIVPDYKLLTEAALNTPGVVDDPRPFVLSTSLSDWYPVYQVNAYIKDADKLAEIYSNLHQNIQDRFNAEGVEIMSPHYMAMRDGNDPAMPKDDLSGRGKQPE